MTVTVAAVSVSSLLEVGRYRTESWFLSALKGWRFFEMGTVDGRDSDTFPPEKRLEVPNTRLIKAGIATIPGVSVPD